jgi:hypothetical protein
MDELNVLSAPAAGSTSTQNQPDVAIETIPATMESATVTEEPVPQTVTAATTSTTAETIPPAASESIDSVAIETVVTEQSVTTTVYTRHPRQDEAEIVAAIETTPPPFAHTASAEPQQAAPDLQPPSVSVSEAEARTATAPTTSPEVLQAATPAETSTETANQDQPERATDTPPAEMTVPTATVAPAGTGMEPADSRKISATLPAVTNGQRMARQDTSPTGQAEEITAVEVTERTTSISADESPVEAVTDIPLEPVDEQPDTVTAVTTAEEEPAAETVTVAGVDRGNTSSVPDVSTNQDIDNEAVVAPVAKTGDWVINLASYTWRSTASRKLALFKQQGVDAEIFEVMINDKPMYRIRVTGFESSRSARAEIPAVEQKLHLEGVWISKR